ncbi:MAG: PTS sugar transporter subunit IIA [Verrucomicrobiota bacterium]
MQISNLLDSNKLKLDLKASKRVDAIEEVAKQLKDAEAVLDYGKFWDELLEREKIEPTVLGHEIALPHARTDALKDLVLAAGRSKDGVMFENCNQNVRLIFVIGTPKRMVTEYLAVVGGLARLLKEEETRQRLLEAEKAEDFIELLRSAEAAL